MWVEVKHRHYEIPGWSCTDCGWEADEAPEPEYIPLRIGREVIPLNYNEIEPWMVDCEKCGMFSGSHLCDGKQHPIGWMLNN